MAEQPTAEQLMSERFGNVRIERYGDVDPHRGAMPWRVQWLEHVDPPMGSSGWRMRYAFFAEHADASAFAELVRESKRGRVVQVGHIEDALRAHRSWQAGGRRGL